MPSKQRKEDVKHLQLARENQEERTCDQRMLDLQRR